MSTASVPYGIFGTTKKNVPGVIFRAMAMLNGISGAPATFVSPVIAMVAFQALITALVLSQQSATELRSKGSAKLRNTKRDLVWEAMETLRVYIQGLANAVGAEAAGALIQSGGLLLGGVPTRSKAILTPALTTVGGLVHLEANAGLLKGKANLARRAMFNWEWSADGKTWNSAPATLFARTDVTGLTPLGTYSFRVSVTVGKVTGAWSQAVSILVTH
jgi:hypothetical protein